MCSFSHVCSYPTDANTSKIKCNTLFSEPKPRTMRIHKELDHTQAHTTFDDALTAVRKAINSTVHTMLNATPTQLVFGHDAFLPGGFEADWSHVATRKQRLIMGGSSACSPGEIKHRNICKGSNTKHKIAS